MAPTQEQIKISDLQRQVKNLKIALRNRNDLFGEFEEEVEAELFEVARLKQAVADLSHENKELKYAVRYWKKMAGSE